MATAFYGTASFRNADGTVQIERFGNADTTLAYSTWDSAGGETTLIILKDCFLTDIVVNITTAGTTLDFKLWINQRDTNIRWVQSANFPTVDNRIPNLTPIPLSAGSKFQLQTIT